MLTPEERKASREWNEANMPEEKRIIRNQKRREYNRKRWQLQKEREKMNK